MQRKYLAVLTVALAAAIGAGAVAAFGTASGQEPASDDESITVSATGSADGAPDEAVLELTVAAEGSDIGTVRDEIATGVSELTATLDELGVEYETSNYGIRQHRTARGELDSAEYAGEHGFTVRLDDPDRAGEVIDAAASAGAEIDHVELTLSEQRREQLRDQAIEAAMDDARHQADTIAAASGLSVTSVSTVDATQQRFTPVRYGAEAADGADGTPPTAIEAGDVSVSYGVSVSYNATG